MEVTFRMFLKLLKISFPLVPHNEWGKIYAKTLIIYKKCFQAVSFPWSHENKRWSAI